MFRAIVKEALLTKMVIGRIDKVLDEIAEIDVRSMTEDTVNYFYQKFMDIFGEFSDAWEAIDKMLGGIENQFLKDVMKTAKTFTEPQGDILIGQIVAMRLNMTQQVIELKLQTAILKRQEALQKSIDTNVGTIKDTSADILTATRNNPLSGTGL
jgi:hypothetical protein